LERLQTSLQLQPQPRRFNNIVTMAYPGPTKQKPVPRVRIVEGGRKLKTKKNEGRTSGTMLTEHIMLVCVIVFNGYLLKA